MNKPIALFDLDSTLADFNASMVEKLSLLAAPNDPPIVMTEVQPKHIRARKSMIKKSSGFWENLPRVEAGFEVYAVAKDLGFAPHILTKGPDTSTNAWTEKVHWCKREVPDAQITISQNKGLVYGRVLVDDWPPYITQWLEWRPRGLVVMLDWPHNQGFEHPNVLRYFQLDYQSDAWKDQFRTLQEALRKARDRA
jgi:5'(3')-deoxyribonucleotidase